MEQTNHQKFQSEQEMQYLNSIQKNIMLNVKKRPLKLEKRF